MMHQPRQAPCEIARVLARLEDVEFARLGELIRTVGVAVIGMKPTLLIDAAIAQADLSALGCKDLPQVDVGEKVIDRSVYGFWMDRSRQANRDAGILEPQGIDDVVIKLARPWQSDLDPAFSARQCGHAGDILAGTAPIARIMMPGEPANAVDRTKPGNANLEHRNAGKAAELGQMRGAGTVDGIVDHAGLGAWQRRLLKVRGEEYLARVEAGGRARARRERIQGHGDGLSSGLARGF